MISVNPPGPPKSPEVEETSPKQLENLAKPKMWKGLVIVTESSGKYKLKEVGLWEYITHRYFQNKNYQKHSNAALHKIIEDISVTTLFADNKCLGHIRNIAIRLGIEPQDPTNSLEKKIGIEIGEKYLKGFLTGDGANINNLKINEIWDWDIKKKENQHDYIQWLFPLKKISNSYNEAPLLTDELIAEMTKSEKFKFNLTQSLQSMLNFYGFDSTIDDNLHIEKITTRANTIKRVGDWTCPNDAGGVNHNYLRITRILECLTTFGMQKEAELFFNAIKKAIPKNRLDKRSVHMWREACNIKKNDKIRPFSKGSLGSNSKRDMGSAVSNNLAENNKAELTAFEKTLENLGQRKIWKG